MEWQDKLKSYFKELETEFNNFEHNEFINKGEFAVYYELLVNNFGKEMKASDIVEKVSLNRSYVYNILTSLEEKGLITTIMESSPKSYIAQNPISYIDKQIADSEKRIAALKSFRKFIKIEIEPELNNLKQLTTSPIKETYFINSILKLTDFVNKSLQKCKERIYFRTSLEFYNSINFELSKTLRRLIAEHKKDKVRIICTGDETGIINFDYPELSIAVDEDNNDYQIVIDDEIIIFNLHVTPFTSPYGVGIMMREKNIADSYSYSINSSFKQIAYKSLPKSSINDLSPVLLSDKEFSNSLEKLFTTGWKIFQTESYPESNYFALVSPEPISIQESRDAGIFYRPFKSGEEKDEVISKIFKENQKYAFQGAIEGSKRFDIEFTFEEKNEIIEGFQCKVLININKGSNNTPWNKELAKKGKPNKDNEFVSRMVAFNYEERAVVMAWALFDENLITLLREIRQNIK